MRGEMLKGDIMESLALEKDKAELEGSFNPLDIGRIYLFTQKEKVIGLTIECQLLITGFFMNCLKLQIR